MKEGKCELCVSELFHQLTRISKLSHMQNVREITPCEVRFGSRPTPFSGENLIKPLIQIILLKDNTK